jgi:hypothetical protein
MQAVCIPNIGRRERRKRMVFGLVVLGAGAAALALLLVAGVQPLWRLPLFLVFWLGLLGVLQAREKT